MSTATGREGERRHVTVMFADVSGFTALARTMDPEDVTDLMNACFGILGRSVVEFGGHVDKYIGDCVMALFGAPTAIEDAPRQAVNAAVVLRERIGEFAARRGIADRLDVHVGINTGLVVYSDVGGDEARDATAMGDTVNVASRLRDAAGARSIYVGTQTHRECAADFRFRRVASLKLKGVEGSYEGWEVLSIQPSLHRSGPAADPGSTTLTPMVGREDAMAVVDRVLADLQSGRGGVLAISGEAGIGKSRLVRELLASPRLAGAARAEGCALRVGASLGLYPLVSLLRSWAGIAADEAPATARARMLAAVQALLGDRTGEVYPFLATVAALELSAEDEKRLDGIDSEGMQWLVTRSLREVVEAAARRWPLVLVLEDLHWADGSTVELLSRLLPLARRERVLFVLAYRPDEDGSSPLLREALLEPFADVTTAIALGPLDPRAAGELLREKIRFDDRPDLTRRAILDRAEGNPFFIEEMVRSLIDVGAIRISPEGLRVTEHMEAVRAPGSIQELVMDRVDRLAPDVREVLQAASVVGRSFSRGLVEAVVADSAAVAPALDRLVALELLEPVARSAGDQFAFRHALAHETVYEAILRRRRRDVHHRVALSIEALHADRLDEFYGSLAFHFSNAEQWEPASHYLVKAGDEAARSTASDEALRCFTEAARIHDSLGGGGADAARRAEIEKKIALACLNKGDLPSALEHLDRALAGLGHSVPRTRLQIAWRVGADLAAILAHLYLRRGAFPSVAPPPEVVEVTELCFHKGKAQSTTAPQGYVVSMLPAIRAVGAWDFRGVDHACGVYSAGAALFAWSGLSFRVSRRLSQAAGALVQTVPDAVIHATMRFVARYLEGDWDDANVLADDLVEDGVRYGAFWEVNTYLGMQCERLVHQGRFAEAAAVLDSIAALVVRDGYDFARTNERAMRAFLLVEAGEVGAAAVAVERYEEVCSEEALYLLALGLKARVQVLAGRHAEAAVAVGHAADLAGRIGRQAAAYHSAPFRVARYALDVAALEAEPSSPALRRAAKRSRREAAGVVAAIARDRPEQCRLEARHAWALGRKRAALASWTKAVDQAERLGARPALARCCREAATALLAAGEASVPVAGRTADALLRRAEELEAQLGREWSLVAARFADAPEATPGRLPKAGEPARP